MILQIKHEQLACNGMIVGIYSERTGRELAPGDTDCTSDVLRDWHTSKYHDADAAHTRACIWPGWLVNTT